jgi:hypothetical protein
MLIGEWQQSQIPGALYGGSQLTLIVSLGARDAAGNDLACFGDVGLQRWQIFVINVLYAFGSKAAEFATTEKT